MKKVCRNGVAAVLLTIGGPAVLNAGFGDSLVGGVVGGVVGSVITNEIYHGHRRHYHGTHRRHRSTNPIMTDEKRIQIALQSLGFYRGAIDGQINSYETRNAIRELNRQYGISEGAYLSPQERDALVYLGTLLDFDRKLNAPGTDRRTRTRRIQTSLKVLGFYTGKLDGSNGPMTRRAIANYREANGLAPGTRLGYEDEYRLISTAKQANDRNIRETMNSLKRMGAAANTGLQGRGSPQPVILQQPGRAPAPSPVPGRMPPPPAVQPVQLQPVAPQGPATPPPLPASRPVTLQPAAAPAPQPVSPPPASVSTSAQPVAAVQPALPEPMRAAPQPSQKPAQPQPVQLTPAP
ncbi:peptidoglycan-binding protein [Nitratifractor sp.]|uniref:peptidoglycan-binding domain-containing protein n=1 Tax=Nitratifractor sp. TaxID=2268144 RepID=UPI0025CF606D|nr:peptidoglycan-binding protein [Nitratifractor sp.]